MALIESEFTQLETVSTEIYDGADAACETVANAITQLIKERDNENKPTVLGLATGSTPVRLYRELIRRHREEGLSFSNVITFNLDEYYGLAGDHPESYRKFMQDQLFDHVDLKPENTHVPDGTVERKAVFKSCKSYEGAIEAAGGIDIQILGIGRTGHIGFNEPGSGPETRTRLVTLDSLTLKDAARDFLGEENVPRHAITMGVGTILDARKVFLLAWGEGKASIIAKTVEGQQTDSIPATFLQQHKDCTFCIDETAASHLTRQRYPWLVGPVQWTESTARKAILWLARKSGKSILKLVEEDYAENGMSDLLVEQGPVHQLNSSIFEVTQQTINSPSCCKPEATKNSHGTNSNSSPKRSLVLSPEPLDGVYCIGGTIQQLKNSGSELTIAYQTSGNLAVPDTDARGAVELIRELGESGGETTQLTYTETISKQLDEKGLFGNDTSEIRHLKGLILRNEARASARMLGVNTDRLCFMDLPFYETGRYRRFVATESDYTQMKDLLEAIQPQQIFTTGYGHDPLSVSSICFSILLRALETCSDSKWLKDCTLWLYRGVDKEWEANEIDMAVPLSPKELKIKLQSIYQHQTQRVQSTDPGTKNIWDVASENNRSTAKLYDALGFAEYEAIECFKQFEH